MGSCMDHRLMMPRRMGGFTPLQYGSDLALWLDPSYGIYTDRSTQLVAASSQYWSVASNATLQTGDVDFWVASWVNFASQTNGRGMLGKWGGTTNEFAFYCGNTIVNWNVNSQAVSLAAPANSTWTFYCLYYDSVNDLVGISVNGGAFTTAAAATGPTAGNSAMFVGKYYASDTCNDQSLDSVMYGKSPVGGIAALATTIRDYLYNSGAGRVYADLTAAQKTAWGLVSAYDFDGDGLDSHGANDLTAVNSPTYTTGIASGTAGDGDLVSLIVPRVGPNLVPPSYAGRPTWYANGGKPYISFDGVNDGLQTASNISLGAFTIAGNFYASGTAGILVEHSANAGGNDGSWIYGTTLQTIIATRSTKSSKELSPNWAVDSTWRTVVHSHNGTHATNLLRLNGVNQTLSNGGSTNDVGTGTATDKLNIACRNQASLFSTMRLGDLCAVNANLSAAQLAQLEPWLIARRPA